MIAIILLAAGASSRMGRSKQLLTWGDTTLIGHAIKISIQSHAGRVFVVLGANESAHREAINEQPVTLITNPSWEKGMGSSIKAGLAEAREHAEACIVMACDQPFVTTDHINNLIEHYSRTRQSIVASKYGETVGIPALFSEELFDELAALPDSEGAKKLIERHRAGAGLVHLPLGEKDIDTPDDYQNAIGSSPKGI